MTLNELLKHNEEVRARRLAEAKKAEALIREAQEQAKKEEVQEEAPVVVEQEPVKEMEEQHEEEEPARRERKGKKPFGRAYLVVEEPSQPQINWDDDI